METQNKQVECPKCGSNQITANKKGFSVGKAIAGDVLLGPVGLLAGNSGRNKIIITCLACGHQFKPGAKPIIPKTEAQLKSAKKGMLIFGCIFMAAALYCLFTHSTFFAIFWGFLSLPCLLANPKNT